MHLKIYPKICSTLFLDEIFKEQNKYLQKTCIKIKSRKMKIQILLHFRNSLLKKQSLEETGSLRNSLLKKQAL